jgi:hypothetical protein
MRLGRVWLAFGWLLACGEERLAPPPPSTGDGDTTCREGSTTVEVEDEEPPEVTCDRTGMNLVCAGSWAVLCDAERRVVDKTNCRAEEGACFERRCDSADDCERCLACSPLHVRCGEDGERERCAEDGSGYEPEEPCDEGAGLYCDAVGGECVDLCEEAEAARSYIGCEYFAVSTSNAELPFAGFGDDGNCEPFSFAVVVANGEDVPAEVTVETPDGDVIDRTLAPRAIETINLPCSLELTGLVDSTNPSPVLERFSSLAVRGAHRITSNVPVTVYQFNPLEYESTFEGRRVNSYTNDASLLLPVSAMTGNYIASTVPPLFHEIEAEELDEPVRLINPAFLTIVGVTDEPTEIEIVATAHTLPSMDGLLPALGPGDTFTFTLQRGEVAQLLSDVPLDCEGEQEPNGRRYCEVPREYDLTGTRVIASNPVQVLSGHDCAFVPFNRWACDHLEEVMQPLEAWGQDVVVSRTDQADCRDPAPNLIRVIASKDDTRVSFEPEIHEPVMLDKGQIFEASITEDVRVRGSEGISVSQLLLGQDYMGREDRSSFAKGDPSLSLAIPTEQWRDRYSILSPETFTDNFVGIIAHQNQVVVIDGRVVTRFSPIEGTELKSAQVPLEGGQHTLESPMPFGVTVYGYAKYTSYMVAGGLDLNIINPPD